MRTRYVRALQKGALLFALSPAVLAQEASQALSIEEVVVTARRVEENIQRVPVAISVVPAELIETTPYFNVENISQLAVGLTATAAINSRHEAFFNIRGQMFGVVNYFDEVHITNPQPTAIGSQGVAYSGIAMDLDSAQVLRGPQGTLFGRNATGGAVLFQSRAPSDEFEAYVEASAGNYSLQGFEGMLNVPLISEKLSLRLVAQSTQRDGFTRNTFDGREMDDLDVWNARATLQWDITDSLQNRLVVQGGKTESQGTGFQIEFVPAASVFRALAPVFGIDIDAMVAQNLADGPRVTTIATPGPHRFKGEDESLIVVNTTQWDINERFTLKNIAGLVESETSSTQNFSGALVPFFSGLTVDGIPGNHRKQFTDELQMQFKAFDDQIGGVVGLFYSDNTPNEPESGSCSAFFTPVPTCTFYRDSVGPKGEQTSKAAFAQLRFDLSELVLEGLRFTAGFRRTKDEVSAGASVGYSGGPGFSLVQTTCSPGAVAPDCRQFSATEASFSVNTYNFDLNYEINPETFVYVATRRGYRVGGFNSAAAQGTPFAQFRPEEITDYEIGLKSSFHIGEVPVRANIAAYTGDFSDLQQNTTVDLSVYNNLPPLTQLGNVTQNAAESTVQGIEVEVTVKPIELLTLSARANYIDAKYENFKLIIQQPGIPLAEYDASNQVFPNTPEKTFGLNATLDLPIDERFGELSVSGDYYHQSDTEGAEGGTLFSPWAKIDSWSIANFSAKWKGVMKTPIDLTAFVNNAFDDENVIGVEAPAVIAYRTAVYNEPRTYGLRFRYTF